MAIERQSLDSQFTNAVVAALFLCAGYVLADGPGQANPPVGPGVRIPMAWVAMPFVAWLSLVALGFGILRLAQAWFAARYEEQMAKNGAGMTWLLVAAVSIYLFKTSGKTPVFFIGGINLTPVLAGSLATLAVVGTLGMMRIARTAASRHRAKGFGAQLLLLAGSILFGLPFAFLIVTSFKEDRDMSSQNGIVWIPKVQQTVPYRDPKNPLFEAVYNGQTVQGSILERTSDGGVRIDISAPLAIRGTTFQTTTSAVKEIPRDVPLVSAELEGQQVKAMVIQDLDDGRKTIQVLEPVALKGKQETLEPTKVEPIRNVGLRVQNYTEAISFLPPETNRGLVYLKNTLLIVILSVLGTILSSSLVAYAFSRMRFPGKNFLFSLLLSTMMLPAAVTLLPQFLIFRQLGWIDTLLPLWVPAFFGSAFNIFLLRQFFMNIPMELEDASKIDGCSYLKTFWLVMLPQIKPALAVIAIWTFMGAWNNFMGPLIYVNSPENMPISYALQLFQGDRGGEPGLLMAFTTLSILPVLALFFFAQKYFIEGVTLSGLGGR
jgi:multiple sugar transport system permease protein